MDEPVERLSVKPRVEKTLDELEEEFIKIQEADAWDSIGVYLGETDEIIGIIRLLNNNPRNRSIEIGYFFIREFRGKGYGKKAMKFVISKLFDDMNINKIIAQTAEFNIPSVNLLKSLGFKIDGLLREEHELDGDLHNEYLFSILKSEYDLEA